MQIRHAAAADLPHIVDIYNAAVPGRLATADTEAVSVASRIAWFRDHDAARHPLWVAAQDLEVFGWLSFSPFSTRPAYRITAEISLYVAAAHHRCGIGQALLSQAIENAPGLGLRRLLGLIFDHNQASLRLFECAGFERWGLMPQVSELDGVERDVAILGRKVP